MRACEGVGNRETTKGFYSSSSCCSSVLSSMDKIASKAAVRVTPAMKKKR